jgi:hypothetical protein
MSQVVQIFGSFLVLVPFVLAQLGRMATSSKAFMSLNLVGSTILAIDAAHGHQWGFLLLEAVWALVSLGSLLRASLGADVANHPLEPGSAPPLADIDR